MTGTAPRGRWVSLEQAAAHASISRATIYRLIQRGRVVAAKVGTRRLVDLDSLDAHLQRCRVLVAPAALEPITGASPDATLSPEV